MRTRKVFWCSFDPSLKLPHSLLSQKQQQWKLKISVSSLRKSKICTGCFSQCISKSKDNDDHTLEYTHHNLDSENLIWEQKNHMLNTFFSAITFMDFHTQQMKDNHPPILRFQDYWSQSAYRQAIIHNKQIMNMIWGLRSGYFRKSR